MTPNQAAHLYALYHSERERRVLVEKHKTNTLPPKLSEEWKKIVALSASGDASASKKIRDAFYQSKVTEGLERLKNGDVDYAIDWILKHQSEPPQTAVGAFAKGGASAMGRSFKQNAPDAARTMLGIFARFMR